MNIQHSFLLSAAGGAIVIVSGVLGVLLLLPAPAIGAAAEAGLGQWRLTGGTLILVGAVLQAKRRQAGRVLGLVFGGFEIFVSVVERDLLLAPYTPLLSGAVLAIVDGFWALAARRTLKLS